MMQANCRRNVDGNGCVSGPLLLMKSRTYATIMINELNVAKSEKNMDEKRRSCVRELCVLSSANYMGVHVVINWLNVKPLLCGGWLTVNQMINNPWNAERFGVVLRLCEMAFVCRTDGKCDLFISVLRICNWIVYLWRSDIWYWDWDWSDWDHVWFVWMKIKFF